MDFFARQDQARRKTKWLVVYFALAVVSMTVMLYGVALLVHGGILLKLHNLDETSVSLWNPTLFFGVVCGTLAIIFIGSAYKTAALADGGSAVAESLGGRLISSNTNQPDERKLLNVVEEMAIASGVPMPKVYVLDGEDGINAFAAGHTPSDAAVAVTHNCMTRLTRDELQGVIGHEFSHILNGDMRLNLRLIGILFGIFCIATLGRILMQVRGSGRDRNMLPLAGLLLLVIGYMGVFFGRLIQAAVSRQREFLADASSVQFTRNPAGLSGALQKIGGTGSAMTSPHASDASHLFFANGLSSSFFDLLATHPPLDARIRAIDPAWDGKFRQTADDDIAKLHRYQQQHSPRPSAPPPLPNLPGLIIAGGVLASEGAPPQAVRPRAVIDHLGNPQPLHLKYAEDLRNALPEKLQAAARVPLDATAVIYALLLSPDDTLRGTQIAGLASRVPPSVSAKLAELYPDVVQTAAHARLPMVTLAMCALRQMEVSEYRQFSETLKWLIDSDGEVELFEFVVQKIVLRHLDAQFNGPRKATVQFYTIKPLVPDCALILSALAVVGSEDPGEVRKAFEAGVPYMHAPDNSGLELLPAAQCGVQQISDALDRLAVAAPIIKKNLIEASARVIGADGVIHESEAELLRAIADTLDCPIPPLGIA
ncbi:MAG: M48 family metallopeptidase [Chthoniobacter sp.]|nr:M48 family metallopeptidase [Chthoniobacter sp.]